jgi:primosomal protein N' (replication factor Y) (superfamily II helicase)
MPDLYAQIVFPLPLKQAFTYRMPPVLADRARVGMRCFLSFGPRQTVGLITGLSPRAPGGVKKLKAVDSLLDPKPLLTPDLLKLGEWMADYYYCSLGEALFVMLPQMSRRNPKSFLELTPEGLEHVEKVETLLGDLGPLRGVNWKNLRKGTVALTPRTQALAEALKSQGLGSIRVGKADGKAAAAEKIPAGKSTPPPPLHPQQQAALSALQAALEEEAFRTFLLQGVTGSGKTEVYLRAIASVLEKGKQAVVLIPEIALTPQTLERFTGRFGDRVAVLHSRLDPGERANQWRRLAEGEASIAVGARSALFAPVPRLGLIVVDEEHEGSYKQDDQPRYHARDSAVKRAQICGAVALLGSATPSLESLHNARTGKYGFLSLPERVNRKPLPRVRVVDLKEEARVRGGDRPVLSLALEEALRANLEKGEQSILFLNRRGLHTVTLCLKCGRQVQCPHCSVPVTGHRVKGGIQLLCHYCDWKGPVPDKCPSCGDGPIRQVGLGTERLEEELQARFPRARLARMDLDTTKERGSHQRILDRFRNREVDILLGTQMIAKGHDFPGVTLVGIVGADTGLALPDFRATERVFQLLVQVAGRAGRADREGVIYLQTFHPEHPGIQAASRHDTEGFWKEELVLREALDYPPFSRLALLVFRSAGEKKAQAAAWKAAEAFRREGPAWKVEVRGPAPAVFLKIRGHYRFQVLLKSANPAALRKVLAVVDSKLEPSPGVFRTVDLDPQSML